MSCTSVLWILSPLFQEKPVSEAQYNLVAYLAYLLYAPLYIAGPIITFNAFASQVFLPTLVLYSHGNLSKIVMCLLPCIYAQRTRMRVSQSVSFLQTGRLPYWSSLTTVHLVHHFDWLLSFIVQLENVQRAYSKKDTAIYGLRWLLCFLLMELLTHRCYFNALAIRSNPESSQMISIVWFAYS